MLRVAFDVVIAGAVLGAGLAILYLRGAAAAPHLALRLIHGVLGAAGLAVLVVVLRRGLPPAVNGTAGFGAITAAFLGLALAFGLLIAFVGWRGRRPGGLLVATHASLAIAGVVMLVTLVALG